MMAAIAGAGFALGILVFLRGFFPEKPSLAAQLAEFNEHDLNAPVTAPSFIIGAAVTLFETVKGEDMVNIRADLDVTGQTIEEAAIERLKGAAGGAALGLFLATRIDSISGVIGLLALGVLGALAGYLIPDGELKKKAEERRQEFTRALTAFITLVGSSISGGGGLATALDDASAMGSGWVFTKIRDALDEAKLSGASPWVALDELGRELRITALIELSGSLTLAGNNGARVTDTLTARAESARAKEIADIRADAEAKSSSLGLPVGLMLLAWAGFMGYPAVLSLMGTA